MLADVVPHLVCPHCRLGLAEDGSTLACVSGHRFDVARQGYVSLLGGAARTGTADTAQMVAARDAVLRAGHLDGVADALAEQVADHLAASAGDRAPLVVDLGAGTGHYLARVLRDSPDAVGLALDLSKFAARRAARSHPRVGAVVADAWQPLPVADHAVDVVLNVFAPRSAAEIARVLRPDGVLLVVVPAPEHLREIVEPLGLLSVEDDKAQSVPRALAPLLRLAGRRDVRYRLSLGHDDVVRLAAMGPSAWHTDPEQLQRAVSQLPTPVDVTVAVHVLRLTRVTSPEVLDG